MSMLYKDVGLADCTDSTIVAKYVFLSETHLHRPVAVNCATVTGTIETLTKISIKETSAIHFVCLQNVKCFKLFIHFNIPYICLLVSGVLFQY